MVGNGPFQTYGQREVVQLLHRADFDTKGEKSSFAAVCLKDRIAIQLITYCQFGYVLREPKAVRFIFIHCPAVLEQQLRNAV